VSNDLDPGLGLSHQIHDSGTLPALARIAVIEGENHQAKPAGFLGRLSSYQEEQARPAPPLAIRPQLTGTDAAAQNTDLIMEMQARVLWDALVFRTPAMLHIVERLSDAQLRWLPPNGVNSIVSLLWHIAEVEDNWIREKLLHVPKHYPFDVSVKATPRLAWPPKSALVTYFHDVRALSKQRLEASSDAQMDHTVEDEHYGTLTVRQVWAGVATSGAWHGGQIAYVNRLLTG
jgi:hypothetical protein